MKQKDVFLASEGNAWLARNTGILRSRPLPESDPVLMALLSLTPRLESGARVFEIGCGDGTRLQWLREARGAECYGIDPSADAVAVATQRGILAKQGTADELPYGSAEFDVVVFGFCLYLCDRDDLFRIASEADRVLRNPGWLLIHDFFSTVPTRRGYHHRPDLFSYKMDYRTLFNWHPGYTTLSHVVRGHVDGSYTDQTDDWVATSVLRKHWSEGA